MAILLACGELCEEACLENPSVVAWRSLGALAAARLDRPEQARGLVELELGLACSFGAPRRTIEMHLTNAYRKLEITSRDELVAALAGEASAA